MESPSSNRGAPRARLPVELMLQIVEYVVPANPDVLLPASHAATKTLLALTRVSHATYAVASRLLRQRCVYVDSSRRLADVLVCVPRFVPTLPPPSLSLRHITSLYLEPFGSSLDDLPTASWTRELLCEVCDTLRRLVIQIPFGSLDPLDDHLNVRRTLRQGFEQLTRLEEFACIGDYPALSVPDAHTDVWRLWPNLRRLALFGVPLDSHWLWWDIATLPELSHVVLVKPEHADVANIKDEYFHKLPRQDPRLGRDIKVVLIEVEYEITDFNTARWKEIDPSGTMTVEWYEVPVPSHSVEDELDLVTAAVKRGALDGTLWTLEGNRVGP